MNPGNILIVDDEPNIRGGLRDILEKEGHRVVEASSGETALEALEAFSCDVALVDIRMPGMSGIELLRLIRERHPDISVLILTGHGTLQSAMKAVKLGARDYLLKPAQPEDIREAVDAALLKARHRREQQQLLTVLHTSLERLKNLGRRGGATIEGGQKGHPAAFDQVLKVGDLTVDLRGHEVHRGDEPIALSPSEFNLMAVMASQPGVALSYTELVEQALGYQAEPFEARELIKRHVFTLRQKIELDPSHPNYVINVRGVGYRLES